MHHAIFVLLTFTTLVKSAKILVMVTTPSPSLFNLFIPIIEGLSQRNHDVTVQSFYPLKNPPRNVREMPLQPSNLAGDDESAKDFFLNAESVGPIGQVYGYSQYYSQICEDYLKDESTKTLMAFGKPFDLVVADGIAECSLVIASLIGKQTVGVLGCANFPWMYSDVPAPPSYVPLYYRRIVTPMTFWERMQNAIDVAGVRLVNDYVTQSVAQKILYKYVPKAPLIQDVNNQIALMLINDDPVLYSPRPSMSNYISFGGIHCREAKRLPQELNDFVESSGEHGFIIFGLGTNMKSKFLPPETRDAILSTFSRLKQKVLWKFETQLENLPKNVKITTFMPQQDLLGHPKIRLFITHAGLLSLQEAVYHGVPVIGMPFFLDQPGNIARIKELGIGEHILFSQVTGDSFYQLINKVLNDESYRNNAKKYSAIFRDQPTNPLERTIYWLEYVIRHDGARHFRPASRDLNIFQYFLLDVISFLVIASLGIIGTAVFVIKLSLRKLWVKKQPERIMKRKSL